MRKTVDCVRSNEVAKLKDIYRALYEMNYEGGEDDYLEWFEAEYAPSHFDGCSKADSLIAGLTRLTGEILDDTGDKYLTRSWAIDAGADETLLLKLGL